MDRNYRSKELRKYFFKIKLKTPIIILILGLLSIYYSSPQMKGFAELGWLATLAAVSWITFVIYRYRTAPSDETVDTWLHEDISNLVNASYAKLGLEKEQIIKDPLRIYAPIYWVTRGIPADEILYRKGKDKVLRFAVYRVTIFLLADHLLASYICDYNFIRKIPLNERTYEYHYQDVVSVTTEETSGSYTLPEGVRYIQAQKFRLSVSSGESIEVVINPHSIADTVRGTLQPTGAEQAVQVIRTMLRSKKVTRDQP